jgi:hypothetical protein
VSCRQGIYTEFGGKFIEKMSRWEDNFNMDLKQNVRMLR